MVILTVLGVIAVLYWIEVRMGNARSAFDCEVGMPSRMEEKDRIKREDFFGKLVPVILAAVGLPLMMQSFLQGILMLAGSASLLILSRRSKVARQRNREL
jgi:hypothetical protein